MDSTLPGLVANRHTAADQPVLCAHCSLLVPASLVEPNRTKQFCCAGCRTVYAVIHDQGLERYYDYRDQEAESRPARTTGKNYTELDDPAFQRQACWAAGPGLLGVELYLEGVHCSACVWLVERVALLIEGAREATLDIGRSVVRVVFDPSLVSLSTIARQLDSLGYPPHPQHGARDQALRRKEDRVMLGRIALAGASAGNVMLMAFALYSGAFAGMEAEYFELFRWGSLLVAIPAVVWSAAPFFRSAWGALRTRTPHMDLPISVGILAGFFWGAVATFRSSGEIYFDSITALIFLLLVGRWIQRRQQHAARDASELMQSLAPSTARLVDDGQIREVPVEAVPMGATVEVRAGEHIPVDGTVLTGISTLDASLLTGESRPEEVQPGSRVHAGSVNLARRLELRVEQTGASTRVGKLTRSMEEAARRRAPVVLLADRVSGWFVLGVLGLAALTFAVWLWLDPTQAVDHTVALLVISCPCALGMATPLAVSAALGRAAKAGLLVKGGDALEQLSRPGLVVFDKTGTLTQGRLTLLEWDGDPTLASWVVAAEAHSAHPVAQAFARGLSGVAAARVSDVRQTLGGGVEATVEGHQLVIGAPTFVQGRAAPLSDSMAERVRSYSERGLSPVVVAVDGVTRALAGFGDPLRADAKLSLQRIHALGHRISILSGDHPSVVAAVARQLDVPLEEARGGVGPEEKLAVVECAARSGTVVMVGDGVNDAAALSAATVGIAVHGGAEASLAAADVFARESGVAPVVHLLQGARRTTAVIRRNIAFSLVYNVVGVSLAITGVVGPLVAAVLMPISSLTVVTSSFRARTFGRAWQPGGSPK